MRACGARWGRWRVSGVFLEVARAVSRQEDWTKLEELLLYQREVFIARAQDCPSGDYIEFWGISRHFEPLAEGELIPLYDVEMQRLESGEVLFKAMRRSE
jgi:hypothetical protein